VDGLCGDYRRAADEKNDAAMRTILDELRQLGRDWQQIGCQSAFGDCVFELKRSSLSVEAVPHEVARLLIGR
jgi:hypothetical protein